MEADDRQKGKWFWGLAPALVALTLVFVAPLLWLVTLSFHPSTGPAQVGAEFTAHNYVAFLGDGFYHRVVYNTLWLGVVVVALCLLIGYPTAYFLARTRTRWRGVLLFLVVAPLLISAVVRNIGWFPILSSTGLVNALLLSSGIITQPLGLVSNMTGIVIGLVHALLPFMIITLTTVIQRIEPDLEAAAANLGASPFVTFREVVLPLSLPGVVAGSLLVFTMTIAAYTTPVIMGGNRVLLLATYIGQQFRTVLDYAAGATAAAVLLAIAFALSALAVKWGGGRAEVSQ